MRIGLVVDATCDLPPEFLAAHGIRVMPIGIRLGEQRLIDRRDPDTTLSFYRDHLPKVGSKDGSQPLSAAELQQWFLDELVTDFDYVVCLTVDSLRSPLGLGSLLDVKPVFSLADGEDKPVALSPSFEKSAEKLFGYALARVQAGELLAPQLGLSYAGDPTALRDLPGFAALENACRERDIHLHLGMLSPTGGINLGAGAMSLGFIAAPKAFA
nr:DegV family protein [Pseudomonas aeruginosa]